MYSVLYHTAIVVFPRYVEMDYRQVSFLRVTQQTHQLKGTCTM